MATSALDMPETSISIGRIFSRAFATIGDNPVATFGIAFVFGALPGVVIGYVGQLARGDLGAGGSLTNGQGVLVLVVTWLLAVAVYMVAQGAMVRATVAQSEGRQASFGECAAAGAAMVLPLLVLGLLTAAAVTLASALLLVPGIILYLMWAVAAPALVAERPGIIGSLRRSRFLTKGARLKIFGLELVLVVCMYLLLALLAVLAVMLFGNTQELLIMSQRGLPLGYLVLTAVVQTLIMAFWGTVHSALYIELRDWKDGLAPEALADVFS